MRLNEEKIDLFTVAEEYYLVHCISADFKMGKGIVIEFNKRFNMKNILQKKYPQYLQHFVNNRLRGDCILEGRILNLITKERYFNKPSIITMRIALKEMKQICIENNINKVAMPLIGCGLDQLKWEDVKVNIVQIFKDTDIEILVCKL